MQIMMLQVLVMQIHLQVVQRIDIVGAGAKSLGDLDYGIFGDRASLQQKRIFGGELLGDVRFQIHRSID